MNVIVKKALRQHVDAWDEGFLFLTDLQFSVKQTWTLQSVHCNTNY